MGRRKDSAAYRVVAAIVRPTMRAMTTQAWTGAEHLPHDRGFLVAVNHNSYLDPLTTAHFLHEHGITPHFLGKVEVFRVPVVGTLLQAAGQIPVYRDSGQAADAYRAAVRAVAQGRCVVIYPEGTFTKDPGLWPMRGKTGAARIALQTRCPVIPVAQWGAHDIIGPRDIVPDLIGRTLSTVRAGAPVDLADLWDRPIAREVLTEATERIMAAITSELEHVRGEPAPSERCDPRTAGRAERASGLRGVLGRLGDAGRRP